MRPNMATAFPKFMRFNEFFDGLKGDFEPVVLADEEKGELIDAAARIGGPAVTNFCRFQDDFLKSARVREVRRYADGRLFARFEFRREQEVGASCCDTGRPREFVWAGPYNLVAVFDSAGNVDSYTLIPEGNVVEDGMEFHYSSRRDGELCYEKTEDLQFVLNHLTTGRGWREVIIYNKATQGVLMNLHGYGEGKRFQLYWVLCCLPWQLGRIDATAEQVEACINALRMGGVRALEDALDWEGPEPY